MSFSTILFTEKGKALQAKASSGIPLVFTRIAMGSGSLSGQSQITLTSLIDLKVSLNISEVNHNSNYATVKGSFSNAEVTTGFYWREIGVFAQDPDLGEILYCYGNAGALAEYIPPSSSEIIEKVVSISIIVGDTANVTAVINESLTFVTTQEFNEISLKVSSFEGNLAKFETAGGTPTAITLTGIDVLIDGISKTFIASVSNNSSATTINSKPLYKPGTTTAPNLVAGKAYTVWYDLTGDCFFIKASAEGDAVAENVLAGKKFSNDDDTGLVGTMVERDADNFANNTVTMKNAVTNGDFSNGTTGWSAYQSTLSVLENTLSILGNGASNSSRTIQFTNIPISSGKKIYLKAICKVTNSLCTAMQFIGRGSTVDGTPQTIILNAPTINASYTLASVITMPSNAVGNLKLDIVQFYSDAITANGKVMEVKDVLAIDLTAIFGAGNEPTKEEIDALISKSGWFNENLLLHSFEKGAYLKDGVVSLPTIAVNDSNLLSNNIKSGVSIFGIQGNSNVVDTSAGDAVAGNILSGKKAYVDGALVTGTMTDHSGAVGSNAQSNTRISHVSNSENGIDGFIILKVPLTGYVDNTTEIAQYVKNMRSENIKAGIKVGNDTKFLTGTYTSDATAVADDMVSGKTAYVNGAKITGNIVQQPNNVAPSNYSYWPPNSGNGNVNAMAHMLPQAGYYNGGVWVSAEVPDLIASNVRSGKNIFGLVGTLAEGKKYVTGTTYTLEGKYLLFKPINNTSFSYYTPFGLRISGLPFSPSILQVDFKVNTSEFRCVVYQGQKQYKMVEDKGYNGGAYIIDANSATYSFLSGNSGIVFTNTENSALISNVSWIAWE